ncbi:MAG: sulfur carrier protein ThiS [Bacteroidales bacterium]|jgi:sulfur carrier protein|nr:sulfur carrier protein ThiS [Bacteroidales bacterium]
MKVKINTQEYDLTANSNIMSALHAVGIEQMAGIAVAVNQKVVSKAQWESQQIEEGDEITVIKAVCGG